MNIQCIVLAKLKETSRFARKKPGSSQLREYYKLGVRNGLFYLMEDGTSAQQIVNRSDIACCYCLREGRLQQMPVDAFVKR